MVFRRELTTFKRMVHHHLAPLQGSADLDPVLLLLNKRLKTKRKTLLLPLPKTKKATLKPVVSADFLRVRKNKTIPAVIGEDFVIVVSCFGKNC